MAVREVRDALGRVWLVWEVRPRFVDRRRADASTPPPGQRERRHRSEPRIRLGAELEEGWLAAETAGERRRIAPIPPGWLAMSDGELLRLLGSGTARRPRPRLSE